MKRIIAVLLAVLMALGMFAVGASANTGTTAMLAAGAHHTIALRSDGTVWAWGANIRGQLGDGTNTNRGTPVRVQNLSNITAIAAGADHSLALRRDGTVWAWGINNAGQMGSGQLGDGTTTNRNTPVQVQGLTNVTAIAAGTRYSLAVRSDGTVWGWGHKHSGSNAVGIVFSSNTPVQVQGLSNITAVAGGNNHSLALRSDGTVWAWGGNISGHLGNGTTGTTAEGLVPAQVLNLTNVTAIAAGYWHSVALRRDGTVWAWGYNTFGQLGSLGGDSNIPRQAQISNVTAISTGFGHVLAVSNNRVWAWGMGISGQLGFGNVNIDRIIPAQLPSAGDSPFLTVAAGTWSSFTSRRDGTVWAWGDNFGGQLGTGTILPVNGNPAAVRGGATGDTLFNIDPVNVVRNNIFGTNFPATPFNWILFFVFFGWLWMWLF